MFSKQLVSKASIAKVKVEPRLHQYPNTEQWLKVVGLKEESVKVSTYLIIYRNVLYSINQCSRQFTFRLCGLYKVVFVKEFKAGFHTCVSRTRNSAQCFSIYRYQCSQAITAFATKACEHPTKAHILNFCETFAMICCGCDL